jgi:hypothetical protein
MSLILLIIVIIAMPLMLFVKPCVWGCCSKSEDHAGEFERIN